MMTSLSVWLQKAVIFCTTVTTPGTVSFSKSWFISLKLMVHTLFSCKGWKVQFSSKAAGSKQSMECNMHAVANIELCMWTYIRPLDSLKVVPLLPSKERDRVTEAR